MMHVKQSKSLDNYQITHIHVIKFFTHTKAEAKLICY